MPTTTFWNVLSWDVRRSGNDVTTTICCVSQTFMVSSFPTSVDPPGNQACHQKPDYQGAAGAARMQLPLHCGLLWGLLQRWGDQHLYGAHGERQTLLAGPTTNEHGIVVVGYQYVVLLNDKNSEYFNLVSNICSQRSACRYWLVLTCLYRMVDPWTRSWKKLEESQKKFWEKLA